MRKNVIIGSAVIATVLSLAACSGMNTTSSSSSSAPAAAQAAPEAAKSVNLSGTFAGLNGKSVAGSVKVDGTSIVLSGFSSDEGPDLHVYLTNGTDEAAVGAGKQIAAVAFDKSSQTFTLSGVDASKYTDVVIHCDKAKAVFGAAPLA